MASDGHPLLLYPETSIFCVPSPLKTFNGFIVAIYFPPFVTSAKTINSDSFNILSQSGSTHIDAFATTVTSQIINPPQRERRMKSDRMLQVITRPKVAFHLPFAK